MGRFTFSVSAAGLAVGILFFLSQDGDDPAGAKTSVAEVSARGDDAASGKFRRTPVCDLEESTPCAAKSERALAALEPDHQCGSDCDHAPERGEVRSLNVTMGGTSGPAQSAEGLRAVRVGDSLRLTAGDWIWETNVRSRRQLDEGRTIVDAVSKEGDSLFLVSMDGAWEGRLLAADRANAWVLSGEDGAGVIESRSLSALLCAFDREGPESGGLPPIFAKGPALDQKGGFGGLVAAETTPILNSLPGAEGVIYLDFDGETVSDKNWNSFYTSGEDIVAGGAGISNSEIQTIWETVSEDYRPFNVNVTTDRAVFDTAASNRRVMVIFTPDNEWYGVSGGVAFIGTFGSSFYDEAAWVFSDQLTYNGSPHAPYLAEAASHEVGHTLGLSHDGGSGSSYYEGHGSGSTSWGPIMGASYNVSVSQWSKGEYSGADNQEDDLAIIAGASNGLGYRSDDFGQSAGTAGALAYSGNSATGSGVIETASDVDWHEVVAFGGTLEVFLSNDATDPNLDLQVELLDDQGSTLAIAAPAGDLDCSLSYEVPGGTYYLAVRPDSEGTASTGYTTYGSLGAYSIAATLPESGPLTATIDSPPGAGISLPSGAGLVLSGSVTAGTPTWQVVAAPAGESVNFSDPAALSTRCDFTGEGLYHLRLHTATAGDSAEDDLFVSVEVSGVTKVYANRGVQIDLGPDCTVYGVSTTLVPDLDDDGVPGVPELTCTWEVLSGDADLSDPNAETPELTYGSAGDASLRLVVSDGEIQTYREVTLTGVFQDETFVDESSVARAIVPVDSSLGPNWKSPAFDDSGWQSGSPGAGYTTHPPASGLDVLYDSLIGAGLDVEADMYNKQYGCYLRVPFSVEEAEHVFTLQLHMKYDDAFVAYLNGTEVARSNFSGTPAWNSRAGSNRDNFAADTDEVFEIALTPGLLVDGENILAIHGMNRRISNNDREFLLLPSLTAVTTSIPPFVQSASVIADPWSRSPDDDPDGDGQSNLVEHAAGTDPTSAAPPALLDVHAGPGDLEVDVCLRLPADPPADVQYELQYRPTLLDSWTTITTKAGADSWGGIQPGSSVPDGAAHLLHIFDHVETFQSYFRVKVTLLEP